MPEIRTDADIAAKERLDVLLQELPPYVKDFLDAKAASKAIRTRLAYAQDLKTFFYYITKKNPDYIGRSTSSIPFRVVSQMGIHDIEEYISFIKYYEVDDIFTRKGEPQHLTRRNGDAAVKRKLASLSAFYGYYYKLEEIPGNPVQKFEAPKLKDPEIITLDNEEVDILITSLRDQSLWTDAEMKYHKKTKHRDLALYTLLLSTGLRVSEVVALDMNDLDFKKEEFRIRRKGGKYQIIGMNPDVVETLTDYIAYDRPFLIGNESEPALFCSIRKKRISARQIEDMTKNINRKLFPLKHVTPHKFRSTFGTSLQRENKDIYLTASALGHSDIATTKKHYAKQDQEAVTNSFKTHLL